MRVFVYGCVRGYARACVCVCVRACVLERVRTTGLRVSDVRSNICVTERKTIQRQFQCLVLQYLLNTNLGEIV